MCNSKKKHTGFVFFLSVWFFSFVCTGFAEVCLPAFPTRIRKTRLHTPLFYQGTPRYLTTLWLGVALTCQWVQQNNHNVILPAIPTVCADGSHQLMNQKRWPENKTQKRSVQPLRGDRSPAFNFPVVSSRRMSSGNSESTIESMGLSCSASDTRDDCTARAESSAKATTRIVKNLILYCKPWVESVQRAQIPVCWLNMMSISPGGLFLLKSPLISLLWYYMPGCRVFIKPLKKTRPNRGLKKNPAPTHRLVHLIRKHTQLNQGEYASFHAPNMQHCTKKTSQEIKL